MKQFKRYVMIGILFVLVTGTLSHFVYGWTDHNEIAGLFTPVNESVWEHMKLLFFPMFIYSCFLYFKFRKSVPCILCALCLGILAGAVLIPALYYAYTGILGKNIFALDISTFILSVIAAFWIVYRLALSCRFKAFTYFFGVSVCLLFACFLAFTYHAPDFVIFRDLQQ